MDKTELDEIRDYTARECLTDPEWAALLSLAYEAVAAQERINGWKREFEKVQAKRDAYRERAEAAEAEATKLREENRLFRLPMLAYTRNGEQLLPEMWTPVDATYLEELEAAEAEATLEMVKALADGYSWLADGRGPYAYEDGRYDDDVRQFVGQLLELLPSGNWLGMREWEAKYRAIEAENARLRGDLDTALGLRRMELGLRRMESRRVDTLREQAEALAGALEAIERETEHVNTRRGSRNGRIREAANAALRAYREATP